MSTNPDAGKNPDSGETTFDVVIAGAGLAGLTLALQLRRELPALRVALIDRLARPLPEASHKVGESSVELGSGYLERLGLGEYLREQHIIKFGLRFFPGGGHLPPNERTEIGPIQEPPVRSYQLDRGRFENDLREMNHQAGVQLFEGFMLRGVQLTDGTALHRLSIETTARPGPDEKKATEKKTLLARWFVDATGRSGLLRRQLKLKRGTNHAANASWFRVKGRLDVTHFVPETAGDPWHRQPFAEHRWRSTNHFMGTGYWVWFIPLSSGNTSVGIVTHDAFYGFDEIRTFERSMQFLHQHEPHLARVVSEALQGEQPLDFRCLNGYSHNAARCWSTERWAIVGEAGAFVDPLYSPGTDFIAFANCFTSELIAVEQRGGDLTTRVRELNLQYRALVLGAVAVFRSAARVYGHPRAMAAKIYWDNFAYWSFPCQYFIQELYRLSGALHVELTQLGARFVELSGYVQALLGQWVLCSAEQSGQETPQPGFVGLPVFPSLLVDAHLDLQKRMNPQEVREYFQLRVEQGEEMVRELVVRVLAELGPELGQRLLDGAQVSRWQLAFSTARTETEALSGVARRRGLSEVARDVERNLGRLRKHPRWAEALALLPSSTPHAAAAAPERRAQPNSPSAE